jgi:ubiquinone/menaquinone biosynthesis C-methylase UbiE
MNNWHDFFKNKERTNYYWSVRRFKWLLRVITTQIPKGKKILETGCGRAILSDILQDYGYLVQAIDNDRELLKLTQERRPQVNAFYGDLLKLKTQFSYKSFYCVVSAGVLEHFSDEEIIDILKQIWWISTQTIFRVPSPHKKRRGGPRKDERLLSQEHWIRLIKKAGYKSIQVYYGDNFYSPWYAWIPIGFFETEWLRGWKRFFSKHYIFSCK